MNNQTEIVINSQYLGPDDKLYQVIEVYQWTIALSEVVEENRNICLFIVSLEDFINKFSLRTRA